MSALNVWNFVQLNGCFLIKLRKRGLKLEQKKYNGDNKRELS